MIGLNAQNEWLAKIKLNPQKCSYTLRYVLFKNYSFFKFKHDGTVLALMNLLDVADGKPIAYGGSFIMEIFEDNNKYYVEVQFLTKNLGIYIEYF